MKKILYGISALVFGLILLLAALPFVLSADFIEQKVIETVREQTGRSLTIGDGTRLSFFPSIGIDLKNVILSNPPNMGDGEMLQARAIRLNLQLWPLLKKRIKVDEFILDHPIIALAVDRKGRANWDFSNGASSSESDGNDGQMLLPDDVNLGDIRIEGGILGYADARSGTQSILKNIFVSVRLPSLAEALNMDGRFDWKGRTINFKSWLKSPKAVMEKQFSPSRLKITTRGMETGFEGNITLFSGLQANGSLDFTTPSVRDLAGWLGVQLPTPVGFGAFSMKSRIKWKGSTLALDNFSMLLDGMKAEGAALVRTGGKRPEIEATLAAGTINIDTYVGRGSKTASAAPAKAGWSTAPIDLSGLDAVNADLRLSAARITYGKIKIGKSALALTLNNGVLKADLGELQLYKGRASGKLTIQGGKRSPAFAAVMSTSAVEALPLLSDAADFNWISGKAAFSYSVSAQGNTQKKMVSTLKGKGKFSFRNGAIEGINIAQMFRGLKKGTLNGWSRAPSAKTDFSILSGSFKIAKGIVSNSDLKLNGPLVRLSGEGRVDLPR
ncbi:MAG TPA: AsmA family protein, partial [Rhizobiales bacterium]|nr:AsmA family protein [Hyphomicrobiales bacterium]